ncbi:MAG: carboxymuconolactone decarboxylase family protein [Telluria sp.]
MNPEPRMNYQAAAPKPVQALIAFARAATTMGPRMIDLVMLRISQINGCAFCVDMHAAALTRMGTDQRKLHNLASWREAHRLFSDRERAALAWAEAMNAIPQRVPTDDEFSALRAHFTNQEITELSCAVTAIRAFNMLNVSFRMPVPERPFIPPEHPAHDK